MARLLSDEELAAKLHHVYDTGYEADLLDLIKDQKEAVKQSLLVDLDEIDNKPWRVFRQLSRIMPGYNDVYERYENFYANGGGKIIESMIELFEHTGEMPE